MVPSAPESSTVVTRLVAAAEVVAEEAMDVEESRGVVVGKVGSLVVVGGRVVGTYVHTPS